MPYSNLDSNNFFNNIFSYDSFDSVLIQEYLRIATYLNYENNNISEDSNTIDFIYYIPNMKLNRPRISEIENIKNYKNDIIDNTCTDIESIFKGIISIDSKKAEQVKNKIKSSIDKIKSIQNDLNIGLDIRENALKDLSVTRNLYDLFENKKNLNVNLIHNKILEKINNNNFDKNLYFNTQKKSIFNIDKNENSVRKNFRLNSSNLENYLLINFDQNSVNNIDIDETGLIVQLFINMTRGLTTLMPNCLVTNQNEEKVAFNFSLNNSLVNVSNESLQNDLWKNINFNNFDFELYYKENRNYLKDLSLAYTINNTYQASGEGIKNNIKNINESDIIRLDSQFKSISNHNSNEPVNFVGIDKLFDYINNNTTLQYDISEGLILNHSAIELKKLLSGDYYNADLNTYNSVDSNTFKFHIVTDNYRVTNTETIIDTVTGNVIENTNFNQGKFRVENQLLNFVFNKNSQSGIENFIKRFIDKDSNNSFIDNYYEQIFVNKKPLYRFKDNRLTSSQSSHLVVNNSSNVIFDFDLNILNNNNKKFDSNYFALKVKNIISQIKSENFNRLGLDLNLFNEITNNIKKSDNKNIFLTYSKEDEENISVLNKNNELFNLLFTESDNIEDSDYNSNFSLNTNKKVHKEKYKNVLNNIENKIRDKSKHIDNLFSLISNYYFDNCFITSSYFLKSVMQDVKDYLDNITIYKYDISDFITQSLYFNYFNDKNKNLMESSLEVKKIVAKRFIKNAIKNDVISSHSLKTSDLKEFVYDDKIYESDSIDYSNIRSAEKTIDSHQTSSPSLNIISNTIFGKSNIDILSESYRYSQVLLFTKNIRNIQDLSIVGLARQLGINLTGDEEYTYELDSNITDLFFESVVATNVFPFIHVIDANHISTRKIKNMHQYSVFPLKRESYTQRGNTWNFNETKKISNKNIAFDLFVTSNEVDEGIILKQSKSKELTNDEQDKFTALQKIFIKDNFDLLCTKENDIFNSILIKVQILLRSIVKDYAKNKIENEEDIDRLINKNSKIIDIVVSIIDVYAKFYDNILERLLTNNSLEKFTQYTENFDFNKIRSKIYEGNKLKSSMIVTDTFKYSQNRNKFIEILKDNSQNIERFYFTLRSSFLAGDYESLLEKYKTQYQSFVLDNVSLRSNEIISNITSNNYTTPYNLQSENLFIDYTSFVEGVESELFGFNNEEDIQRSPVSSSQDQFIKKINDVFYSLVTSEAFEMLNLDLVRAFLILLVEVQDKKNNIFNQKLLEVAKYLDVPENMFFDKINNFYFQNILVKFLAKNSISRNRVFNDVYSKISTQSILEFYEENNIFDFYRNSKKHNDYLQNLDKKEIFALNVTYDNIKDFKNNSFIKVTILPKDMCDNNKVYLPKTYIFSLSLTDLHTKLINQANEENEIMFFKKDNATRFSKGTIVSDENFTELSSTLSSMWSTYFKSVISSPESNIFDNMSKDIYKNHLRSSKLNDTVSLLLGVDLYNNFNYNDKAKEFVDSIAEDDFQQIYPEGKQKFVESLYNNVYSIPREFNKSYCSLVSNNEIFQEETYDNYIFDIDLNDLPFYYKKNVTGNNNFKTYQINSRKIRDLYFEKIRVQDLENLYVDSWSIQSASQDVNDKPSISFSIKVEVI